VSRKKQAKKHALRLLTLQALLCGEEAYHDPAADYEAAQSAHDALERLARHVFIEAELDVLADEFLTNHWSPSDMGEAGRDSTAALALLRMMETVS
jgi:hypothetical protein